jgi:hypothetical protein
MQNNKITSIINKEEWVFGYFLTKLGQRFGCSEKQANIENI